MVGDFLRNNINPDNFKYIDSGTPVVVDMGGVFPRLQFGIYAGDGVIIQRYVPKLSLTVFECKSLVELTDNGHYDLYEYTPTKYSYSKTDCLSQAKSYIGAYFIGYSSVFGDDFVFKCLVGDRFDSLFSKSKIGRHYRYRYNEHGVYLFHHFISIEEDWVIHFSDGKYNQGPTILRIEDFYDVISRTEFAIEEVTNDEEPLIARIICRNRALFEFATGENFGGYNIAKNNCEHFANFCRTGKKKSGQVGRMIGEIALAVIATYATKKPLPIFLLKKRYFDKY